MNKIFDKSFKPYDLIGAYIDLGTIKSIVDGVFEVYNEDEKTTKFINDFDGVIFYIGESEFNINEYKNIITSIDNNTFKPKNCEELVFAALRYIDKKKSEDYKYVELEYENINSSVHSTLLFSIRRKYPKVLERYTEETNWDTDNMSNLTNSYFKIKIKNK